MCDLLTVDELSFQEHVAAVVREHVTPHAAQADASESLAGPAWDALAREGYLGIAIPREYGGMGRTMMDAALAAEEVSYACPSTALSFGAHTFLCVQNLYHHAGEELRRRYLPDLCSGKRTGAFALTEPGAGSDATGLTTRAVRDGDTYLLQGSKTFITNGPFADVFLVYARTAASEAVPQSRSLSLFVVERGTPGFEIGRKLHKLGFRGSPTSELMFDQCRIAASQRIGEEGDGIRIMMASLDLERSLMSTIPLGMARRVVELATTALRGRVPHPDGEQEPGARLAEMIVGLEALRGLAYRAIRGLESGRSVTVPASCAKLYGAEMIMQITSAAVVLLAHEEPGVRSEAERLMRDAKLISIGAGSSEVQKLILGRMALKHAHT